MQAFLIVLPLSPLPSVSSWLHNCLRHRYRLPHHYRHCSRLAYQSISLGIWPMHSLIVTCHSLIHLPSSIPCIACGSRIRLPLRGKFLQSCFWSLLYVFPSNLLVLLSTSHFMETRNSYLRKHYLQFTAGTSSSHTRNNSQIRSALCIRNGNWLKIVWYTAFLLGTKAFWLGT